MTTQRTVGKDEVIVIGDLIAKGGEARIYSGKFDDKEVVVKRLDLDNHLLNELEILRKVYHHNVVRYLYKDVDLDFMYIVLEKCQHTLQQVINDGITLSLTRYELLRQIANGLDYLHNVKKMIHRDLKPSNILLAFEDDTWTAKISDFGISKKLQLGKTSVTQTTKKGTVGYVAPELLKGEKIQQKSDIFSLGIVYYYVLSGGNHPFGSDNYRIEVDIRDGVAPKLDSVEEKYAIDAKDLISSMIAKDPKERLNVRQVLAHYIFWDADKTLNFLQEASDHLKARAMRQSLISELEKGADEATGKNWRKKILELPEFPAMTKKVEEKTSPKKCKVQDLLRLVRNWKHHYSDEGAKEDAEVKQQFRDEIGRLPDGLLNFFKKNFPKLLHRVYQVISKESEDPKFKKYYSMMGSMVQEPSGIPPVVSGVTPQGAKIIPKTGKIPVLRKYQWELAEQALNDNNSMIVAPTGSGKTTVAYEIIKKQLEQNKNKCVLFFASKTALAQQQYKFFERNLECPVTCIIGKGPTAADSGRNILSNRVTVLTPQILINELKKPTPSITFEAISAIIFDECHNAIKRHPYNVIMEMLLDFQDGNKDDAAIQIVGLTASPGVGKASGEDKVLKNLFGLLANLNIKCKPAIVEKNLEELKKHQNKIAEYFVAVKATTDNLSEKLMQIMSELENKIETLSKDTVGYLAKPPVGKATQAYEKWTTDVILYAAEKITDPDLSIIIKTYAEHLNMYCDLLMLKDLIPNAIQHTNKFDSLEQSGDVARDLREKNEALEKLSKQVQVPMLEKLFEILKREFRANSDTSCLVFVKRKLTATCLVQCMRDDKDLENLNPMCLLGANESPTSGGMTKAEQENSLQAFSTNECRVLVATSVAEEGLDISECNLVISYNYVTGEVGRIQRAGRGRATNSKSILITLVGSDHFNREQQNRIYAEATDRAIKEIRDMSDVELAEKISRIQKDQKMQRARKAAAVAAAPKDPPSKWAIFCGKCKSFITTGDKLRDIEDTHTVVKDVEFESRVTKRVREVTKGPVTGTAEFFCKTPECREKLALNMHYDGLDYPTLSLKKLAFRVKTSIKGDFRTCKKRMSLPFYVDKSVNEMDENEPEDVQTAGEESGEVLKEDEAIDIASMDKDDIFELLDVEADPDTD